MAAYYNEFDPFAAAWLRELIKAGHIAPGEVDTRSIEDVVPSDLDGFTQCHFFAGIGVWSYALRLAGWPDDRQVWTGSCPCQPFSAAGKGNGFADERHLWPAFHHLIRHHRPVAVFGEQVASKDGLAWLDLVQADLEGEGYAFGAVDTCAAGFGAPHIRQRLYWVADARHDQHRGRDGLRHAVGEHDGETCPSEGARAERERPVDDTTDGGTSGRVADTTSEQYDRTRGIGAGRRFEYSDCSPVGRLADAEYAGHGGPSGSRGERIRDAVERHGDMAEGQPATRPTDGHWRDADWLLCRDGKWRPVEPGTFPLAHGAPNRVGRLRGYGNAIVAPQAAEFVKAYLSTLNHI